jgi:hypothetical protein
MSCESSTWLPEGVGARVVLHPPMAGGKKDHEWNRTAVMSGIRKCFPFMTNEAGSEESDVASAWTERFRTTPKDGRLEDLPQEWKLDFKYLPMYKPARCHAHGHAHTPACRIGACARTHARTNKHSHPPTHLTHTEPGPRQVVQMTVTSKIHALLTTIWRIL